MAHMKELLSLWQNSCERIVLLFCSSGNPLSDFVGVNGQVHRPYADIERGRVWHRIAQKTYLCKWIALKSRPFKDFGGFTCGTE
jgi:hypothetical protein